MKRHELNEYLLNISLYWNLCCSLRSIDWCCYCVGGRVVHSGVVVVVGGVVFSPDSILTPMKDSI